MKRFLVFAGDSYYPGGGMNDFKKDFEELVEAQAYAQGLLEHADWAHIYDQVNRETYVPETDAPEVDITCSCEACRRNRICPKCKNDLTTDEVGDKFCPTCGLGYE